MGHIRTTELGGDVVANQDKTAEYKRTVAGAWFEPGHRLFRSLNGATAQGEETAKAPQPNYMYSRIGPTQIKPTIT